MEILSEFLRRNAESSIPVNVHIVGDSMLDEDYEASLSRLSPECSNIGVLRSNSGDIARVFPGGAANVYYQLMNFNTIPRLFSLADSHLFKELMKLGIKNWGHVALPEGCHNPIKRRFYDGDFQVGCRWDIEIENDDYGLEDRVDYYRHRLYETWLSFQAEPDVVIFSDYNKGVFDTNGIYPHIRVPTIVDPKKAPVEKWKGCTIFKPNGTEAKNLSGLKDWKDQCDFFKDKLNCHAVVITQEGSGVVGKEDDYFEYRPKKKADAFQVIGAGDSFIGMLALAIAHEFTVKEAAEIAFKISTLYVQQEHRSVLHPANLGVKVIDPIFLRNRNFKLAFTNGCFDLLHAGHLETLKFAKSKADKLVVALNSDESVRSLKGLDRPILSLKERVELISALEFVDFVVTFEEDRPQSLIEKIMPDVLVKGQDWANRSIAGEDCVEEIHFVSLIEGKSTTSIIERIRNGKEVQKTDQEVN